MLTREEFMMSIPSVIGYIVGIKNGKTFVKVWFYARDIEAEQIILRSSYFQNKSLYEFVDVDTMIKEGSERSKMLN